ncbi:MAG: hypothetical protein VW518_11845, partial [Burkholderiaceae bacterium]
MSSVTGNYDLYAYIDRLNAINAQFDLNAYANTQSWVNGSYDLLRYVNVITSINGQYDLTVWKTFVLPVSGQYDLNAYKEIVSYITSQYNLLAYEAFWGWIVNLETLAVSRYEGFNFNSLDGEFGSMDDGIYQLTGATNNGNPIDAFIEFGRLDFNSSQLKRITDAYIAASSDGDLQLDMSAQGFTSSYNMTPSSFIDTVKLNLGRGQKDRYWKPKISNVSGSDMRIDNVEFTEEILKRKIRS